MLSKEGAVATIQDVDFRIRESRIEGSIYGTILGTNMASHEGSPVCGILAVEYQQGSSGHGSVEELTCEQLLVVVVDCSVNMAAFVLVLKTAIDDHFLIEIFAVLAIYDIHKRILRDPRDRICWVIEKEVREHWLLRLFNIHNGLESRRCRLLGPRLHDLIGVFKHAQRSAKLFSISQKGVWSSTRLAAVQGRTTTVQTRSTEMGKLWS